MNRTTRFSGADWFSELKDVTLVGVGGIGSWTALNLARIGHSLMLIDPDFVDITNVTGGQMFRSSDIGVSKVDAVLSICRQMGCEGDIDRIRKEYDSSMGSAEIMITGLDNMAARKECYEGWKANVLLIGKDPMRTNFLFIDGRLTMEMMELLTIKGDDEKAMQNYEKDYLFSDEESIQLDCTTKQSTFAAMGIASSITAILCNFLTNRKLGSEFRATPFYYRLYYPAFIHTTQEASLPASEAIIETIKEEITV